MERLARVIDGDANGVGGPIRRRERRVQDSTLLLAAEQQDALRRAGQSKRSERDAKRPLIGTRAARRIEGGIGGLTGQCGGKARGGWKERGRVPIIAHAQHCDGWEVGLCDGLVGCGDTGVDRQSWAHQRHEVAVWQGVEQMALNQRCIARWLVWCQPPFIREVDEDARPIEWVMRKRFVDGRGSGPPRHKEAGSPPVRGKMA